MTIAHFRSGNRLAPWWTLDPIARPFGRLLRESGVSESAASWIPPVNVEETTDELILTANLPGFTEESIQIGLENGVLTICGEIEDRPEGEDRRYHLHERPFGRFERSFTVPPFLHCSAQRLGGCGHGHLRQRRPPRPHAEGARGEGADDPDREVHLRCACRRTRAVGSRPGEECVPSPPRAPVAMAGERQRGGREKNRS